MHLTALFRTSPSTGDQRGHFKRSELLTTQLIKVMKLTTVMLFAFCLHVSARTAGQTVTYSAKNVSLEQAFAAIKQQTGYVFFYNYTAVKNAKPVSIDVKNAPIRQTLDELFKDQALTYSIEDKQITVRPKSPTLSPEKITGGDNDEVTANIDVKGKVVDEKGNPVVAAVSVKGTGRGVVTNERGEFTLTGINNDAVLIITSVNIARSYEVAIKGRTDITIKVELKVADLDEIGVKSVSSGYQKVSSEKILGSFSKLDSAAYNRRVGMKILDRLDGTVTGILFDKKGIFPSGPPLVRGISSIGSLKGPLIVVDNFPYSGDLNLINPNDVESIDVLKDAASASVWGAYAGSGVIVITTKGGRFNSPMRVNFQANTTVQEKPDLFYFPQLNTSDLIDIEKLLFSKGFYDANLNNTTNRPVVSSVVEILAKQRAGTITQAQADAQINSLRNIDFRNELNQYVYQPSIAQQYYLSLSGGNSNFSYNFSGGYNKSRPNVQGSKGQEQYTLTSNNSFRPIKNLELTAGINFTKGINKESGIEIPNASAFTQLQDVQGNYLPISKDIRLAWADTAGGGKLLNWLYRPLEEIRLADNRTNNDQQQFNFGLSYKFLPWLKGGVYYRYLQQRTNTRNLFNTETYTVRDLVNRFTQIAGNTITYNLPKGASLFVANNENSMQNFRGQLDIAKKWRNHEVTALIAGDVSEVKSSSNSSRFYGYDPSTGSYPSSLNFSAFYPIYGGLSSSSQIPVNQSVSDDGNVSRLVSLVGNLSYSYKGLYSIYGSARKDGANVFGATTNNKWKPLWSVAVGWNLSKESFYHAAWLPYLRLRASYGFTGIPPSQPALLTTSSNGLAPYTNLPQSNITVYPNPDLRWEKVNTINMGIDFAIFKSRSVSGSLEFFRKKSTDLIASIPIDPTTGVAQLPINYAGLKGTGFEVMINTKNLSGKLSWGTSFGLSYVKTVVTQLYAGVFKASDYVRPGLHTAEGQQAFAIVAYRWAGLDPVTGDPEGYLGGQVSKNYTGIFSDSLQNQVVLGSSVPLYSAFLTNSFSWKGFTLSANITFKLKYYFQKPALNYNNIFQGGSSHPDYALRWQKPGDESLTNVPSLTYPVNSNRDAFYQYSELNVLRGDHMRLQDVRLQYSVGKDVFRKLPFQNVQIFLYANNLNLILWRADRSNFDPDFTGGGSEGRNAYPTPKTWTGGLSFGF